MLSEAKHLGGSEASQRDAPASDATPATAETLRCAQGDSPQGGDTPQDETRPIIRVNSPMTDHQVDPRHHGGSAIRAVGEGRPMTPVHLFDLVPEALMAFGPLPRRAARRARPSQAVG